MKKRVWTTVGIVALALLCAGMLFLLLHVLGGVPS